MKNRIIQTQIQYYRARAAEYDEWFYRKGRYDHGDELNQKWFGEVQMIQEALENAFARLPETAHVLEFAGGTGIWTEQLHRRAEHVTVVDASPEMLAINQAKLNSSDRMTYIEHDIFSWEPAQTYDMVFFSFWLSHVPPEQLDDFLSMVHQALKPGGQLFFIDSRREVTSTAHDHVLPEEQDIVHTRKLNDGREFEIIKIFYEPEFLNEALKNAGVPTAVMTTPAYFIYGHGHKEV